MTETETATTTIKIPSGDRFDKRVPIGINGAIAHIDTDTDTPVGQHVLDALDAAGIKYDIVSSTGEGQGGSESGVGSGSSTVEGTAQRSELHERLRNEATGAEAPSVLTTPPVLSEGEKPEGDGGNGEGTGDGSGGESLEGQGGDDTLDGTVEEVKAALDAITDPAEIDGLIAAEKAGKNRTTALSALEARKTALASA